MAVSSTIGRRLGAYGGEQLRRVARHGTIWLARVASSSIPMLIVSGYPKSGTSWLSFLLADYLVLPRPDRYLFPIAMPAVIHTHASYSVRYHRAVYIIRDGRDVMVSYYFHRMNELAANDSPVFARSMRMRYAREFGSAFDPGDVKANLPAFIDLEMRRPRGSRLSWPGHVRSWCWPRRPDVIYVSYEELLRDPQRALYAVVEELCENTPDRHRIAATVRKFSFSAVTGREPGSERSEDFMRKGVAGDWRTYFTRESAEAFAAHAGVELVSLGYEPDSSWVAQIEPLSRPR